MIIKTFTDVLTKEVAIQLEKKFMTHLSSKTLSEKSCIYVCGSIGSGKTTIIKQRFVKEYPDHYYFSSDCILRQIGELTTVTDVAVLYTNAKIASKYLTDYLLESKKSFIIEGTGSNIDICPFLQKLRLDGYHVKVFYMKTPLEECIRRAIERNEKVTHKIPIEIIGDMYNILWKTNMAQISECADETDFFE